MSALLDETQADAVPTESVPEPGFVTVADVCLLDAVRFVDDDAHFIRALECDVRGEGDSLDEAVHDFVLHALDFTRHVAALIEAGEATDAETRVHALLSDRFAAIVNAYEEQERRRRDALRDVFRRRRARVHRHHWRPTPRDRSATPLHA